MQQIPPSQAVPSTQLSADFLQWLHHEKALASRRQRNVLLWAFLLAVAVGLLYTFYPNFTNEIQQVLGIDGPGPA